MAAYTVGSVTFDLIESAPHIPSLQQSVVLLARAGLDAYEAVKEGDRAAPVSWTRCMKWSTNATNAKTHVEAVEALRATVVTCRDPHDLQYDSVLVEEVSVGPIRTVIKDGLTVYETAADVTLRRLA